MIKHLLLITCLYLCTSDVQGQILGKEILPNNGEPVEISFDFSNGFIAVKVKIEKLPLTFLLDTGAEHVILFKKVYADLLGLEYNKKIELVGADLEQRIHAFISRNVNIQLVGTKEVVRDIIVLEKDFLQLEELIGESIDGIIGSRFLRSLVLHINYKKRKILLADDRTKIPQIESFTELNAKMKNNKPYLNTIITNDEGDTLNANLLLDTGSAIPLLLNSDAHPHLKLPEVKLQGNLGRGLGGNIEGYLSKINRLDLGVGYKFDNMVVCFQDIVNDSLSVIAQNRHGLLGNKVLSRFDVVIDYVTNRVHIKPRRKYDRKFKYDLSGLVLFAYGPGLDQYYVKKVMKGSPAEKAGIKEKDIVKKIGILPASYFSLSAIYHKLSRKNGKKLRLTVERGGKKLRKTIVLKNVLEKTP